MTLALVVSTVGEAPVTVTVSATLATRSTSSSGTVWPTVTATFSRSTDWKPWSSIRTV